MDNSKKNVHSSGPLGMLVRSGQIKSIENDESQHKTQNPVGAAKGLGAYFRTQAGIEFSENELSYVDPKMCEPWEYANRLKGDMGDIDELTTSIKENKQLQPALIRPHPKPHGNIKYEVIFGRRRLEACLRLGMQFLVIKKDIPNIREAIIFQETENRLRRDVSHYSNAMHYKRLLEDSIFKNEREMSEKLGVSLSKLYDIMAFSKIPEEIVKLIPDIHGLSNSLALKIVSLYKEFPEKYEQLIVLAPKIGSSISSPVKLEKALKSDFTNKKLDDVCKAKIYKSIDGRKLFTFKKNHRGSSCIEINKGIDFSINYEKFCDYLKKYLEKECRDLESLPS